MPPGHQRPKGPLQGDCHNNGDDQLTDAVGRNHHTHCRFDRRPYLAVNGPHSAAPGHQTHYQDGIGQRAGRRRNARRPGAVHPPRQAAEHTGRHQPDQNTGQDGNFRPQKEGGGKIWRQKGRKQAGYPHNQAQNAAKERALQHQDVVRDAPNVLGVTTLGDSGVTIRTVCKVTSLAHWEAERQLRVLLKERLEREGMSIPYPHVVVTDKKKEQ